MNKANFTQGKWEVIDGHYPSILEIKCGECMRMPVVMSATDVTFEQGLEREANARLIAAAPEMYEVLDSMIEQFEYDGCTEYEFKLLL